MVTGRKRVYDAIVVGSGMTGGWAAKELTEAGLDTLVLEAGPAVVPERDYAEHTATWELPYRGLRDRRRQAAEQPIQAECYACDEVASKFFVNDLENPYVQADGKPFSWIRGRQVGGRSIMWARQVYRWSDLDFEANAREGIGIDWPIRYRDLSPWYDRVDRFIGVSGRAERLPQLPDGVFQAPMRMSCVERAVSEAVNAGFDGERRWTIGRAAVLTEQLGERAPCHYCGPCHRGCITRSYFSSLNATLPVAAATGRMTLRPNSVVHSVVWDRRRGRVSGVRVIDRESHDHVEFEGSVIFLAASALESTRLLLNSTSTDFPDGLANTSGVLGHYLMDHTMGVGATAAFPDLPRHREPGRRPNGIYVARFRNVTSAHPDFVRGYGFQGWGLEQGWERAMDRPGFGPALKERLSEVGPWQMEVEAFGECLPNHENYVELDPDAVDAWGIPVLRIHCQWGDNERAMKRDMAVTAAEMLDAAGGRDVEAHDLDTPPGLTIHEMGTARMGHDPATSVLNRFNQAHDVKNLFVVDGAAMASSACQNPSLTYMAMTARACAYAVAASRSGEL
jgi:choline dehydrogenase-like flavoprotein